MTGRIVLEEAFALIIESREPAPSRDGTRQTPFRAMKAWVEKTRGYEINPKEFFRTFEDHGTARGMVLVRDIEVESLCEHHLERIWGYAHIAYVPNTRVLGLSKFTRVVDALARRLQVQERLTAQIADLIMEQLKPQGVGVVIEARHGCMEARGICKRGQVTVTSELRGCFYDDATTRAEFLSLARTQKVF